jgi:hypothetical protein
MEVALLVLLGLASGAVVLIAGAIAGAGLDLIIASVRVSKSWTTAAADGRRGSRAPIYRGNPKMRDPD